MESGLGRGQTQACTDTIQLQQACSGLWAVCQGNWCVGVWTKVPPPFPTVCSLVCLNVRGLTCLDKGASSLPNCMWFSLSERERTHFHPEFWPNVSSPLSNQYVKN